MKPCIITFSDKRFRANFVPIIDRNVNLSANINNFIELDFYAKRRASNSLVIIFKIILNK